MWLKLQHTHFINIGFLCLFFLVHFCSVHFISRDGRGHRLETTLKVVGGGGQRMLCPALVAIA